MAFRSRRFALTVTVSLAIHAVAVWAMSSEKPAVVASKPLEMWFEAQVPPPPPSPSPVSPRSRPPSAVAPSAHAATPKASAPASAGTSETRADSAGGTSQGDVPLAPSSQLVPNSGFVMNLPSSGQRRGGTTVVNGPGEEPDPIAKAEYESAEVARKLNAELAQDIGTMAREVGTTPLQFVRVEQAMRASLAKRQPARTAVPLGEAVRKVAQAIFTPEVTKEAADKVANSALGHSIAMGTVPTTGADDQRWREQAAGLMGAALSHQQRINAPQLTTVLEMVTTARGTLAELNVVEKSGDPVFDESVMHMSRAVVRGLADEGEGGLGTAWWKSTWRFTYEPPKVKVRLMSAHQVKPP